MQISLALSPTNPLITGVGAVPAGYLLFRVKQADLSYSRQFMVKQADGSYRRLVSKGA